MFQCSKCCYITYLLDGQVLIEMNTSLLKTVSEEGGSKKGFKADFIGMMSAHAESNLDPEANVTHSQMADQPGEIMTRAFVDVSKR